MNIAAIEGLPSTCHLFGTVWVLAHLIKQLQDAGPANEVCALQNRGSGEEKQPFEWFRHYSLLCSCDSHLGAKAQLFHIYNS